MKETSSPIGLAVSLFVVVIWILPIQGKDTSQDLETYCVTIAGVEECRESSEIRLSRLAGAQVGDTEEVDVGEGHVLGLTTLSQKPLIIEIPGFLSQDECEHFIRTAEQEGLQNSVTTENSGGKDQEGFKLLDKNADRKLNMEEMRLTIEAGMDIYLNKEDILKMYEELGLDKNGDELVSQNELKDFSPMDLKIYLNNFLQEQPEKHSRYSKQVWLYPDNSNDTVFDRIQHRVSRVVNLPIELIKMSDFQVVTYGVKGHYNAHFDSSEVDISVPCCTRTRGHGCRICRYMTMLFYLSDVEEGGETAFPLAGNVSLDFMKLQEEGLVNLYERCSDANLHVAPAAGKAILWYNHEINPDTGWLGKMDRHTFHGGCPVTKGQKWIANFWIKTTDNKLDDLQKMKTFSRSNMSINRKDEL